VQTVLPVLGNAAILVLPVYALLVQPQGLPQWMHDFSDPPGWLALLLCAAAAGWYLYQTRAGSLLHVLGGVASGAGVLIACTVSAGDTGGNGQWQEYHLLFTTWTGAAFLLLGVGLAGKSLHLPARVDKKPFLLPVTEVEKLREQAPGLNKLVFPKQLVEIWVTVLGFLAMLLGVLYCNADIAGAWWRLDVLLGLSLASGIVALWMKSVGHVFVSGLLLNAAASVAWIAWRPGWIPTLVEMNVLALAASSVIWTLIQFVYPQGVIHPRWIDKPLPFAHLAAAAGLAALGTLAAVYVTLDLSQLDHDAFVPMDWYAVAAIAAAIALLVWDRTARLPLLGLYVSGLVAIAMQWNYWHEVRHEAPRMLCLRAGSDLAAFALVTALVGWLLPKARWLCRWLWIPDEENRWPIEWFMQVQALVAVAAGTLGVWVALDFGFDGLAKGVALFGTSGRVIGITTMLMVLGAAIVMAWQSKPTWRIQWQYASFIAGLFLLSSLRWSGIDPAQAGPWLHRSVVFLISTAMMTMICSFGLKKVISGKSDWIGVGRRMTPWFGGAAILTLGLVLAQEWMWRQDKIGTPLVGTEIIVVAVIMAAMLATCLAFAVRADWDPLRLSISGRQAYVYIAEALAVLIGVHLRLTKPELFNFGFIKNYWMYLIMATAFAGAGLSEWFQRRKLHVLSLPLERTALLLPLLPAIGFWFLKDPQTPLALIGRTPDVWFLMGAFYGLLAYIRRSVGCGLLAVLTANMGLWVALHHFDIGFLHHPQLWLIPIAMAALAAEFLHHERLSATQSTVLRYLSLSVIYVSSTADMFIDMFLHGADIDWRLPVVLMLLATAGAMAGVLLRIRSFLILGITFLVLDIVVMIRYAAVDLHQTWVWSASGIVLGAVILAVFAFFEKRRHDLLAAMERFKDWER
jgi:hypothetical protein